MSIQETIKADLTTAMKAGEKERVSALRLVLAELQKDEKEGKGDELAVLRRERKRRIEAAEQFEAAGREDLAGPERSEVVMITAYLPAELGDDELKAIVEKAVAESDATGPGDIGQAMKSVMQAVDGKADGKRVNALVREVLGA